MDPNNQQPQNNPYDFILNSQQPKQTVLGGGSQKQRIIVVVAGAVILLIIATIAISIISNAGKANYSDSLSLVKNQRELLQASKQALDSSPNADTRIYAATLSTSLTSDNQQLEAFLLKNGQKDTLATVAKENKTIKESLEKAGSNNNFDAVYKELIDKLLTSYVSNLKTANADAKTKNEKALLESSFQHVRTIVGPTDTETTE